MIDRTKLRTAATRPSSAKTPQSEQVQAQQAQFDQETEERAELMREANALRDLMLAQLKDDDEVLKKYIAMI